jgi:hypothetical protein
VGLELGIMVGRTEGLADGWFDDCKVGLILVDGGSDGEMLGKKLSDRFSLAEEDGVVDDMLVGFPVGFDEGMVEGKKEGNIDGIGVWKWLGFPVGMHVG